MSVNNQINSPTNSMGWTSFTTSITATTTTPTLGTIVVNNSYYLQMGKTLYIKYNFYQTVPGTAGSGTYLFNIPAGFSINTVIESPTGIYPSIGSGTIAIQNFTGILVPYVYDVTHYALLAYASTTTNVSPVGSTFFSLASNNASISVGLQILIN